MDRRELITKCQTHLGAAKDCAAMNEYAEYGKHMSFVLDLLIEELVGTPPKSKCLTARMFNPEQVLEQIAIAIRHRTISLNGRWNIVYYHTRITCVPSYTIVPSKIILHEFTTKMANKGFTAVYWNQLKQNVIKLYKELES